MKQLTILLTCLLMVSAASAQGRPADTIPADRYNAYADFTIGYYMNAYLQKKLRSSDWAKENAELLMPLKANTVEAPVSRGAIDSICEKLPTMLNGENLRLKATTFHTYLDSKRRGKKYHLDSLLALNQRYGTNYLADTIPVLRTIIQGKLNAENSTNVPTAVGNNNSAETGEAGPAETNAPERKIPLGAWIAVSVVVSVALWEKWLRKLILSKSIKAANEKNLSEKRRLRNEIEQLSIENVRLKREINSMRDQRAKEPKSLANQSSVAAVKQQKEPNHSTSATLYSPAIIDGCFYQTREVPDSDTIFKIDTSGDRATFTIHQAALSRIVSNPSFLEGCDRQVITGGTSVEILEAGEASRQSSDGRWQVTRKLKIIIR